MSLYSDGPLDADRWAEPGGDDDDHRGLPDGQGYDDPAPCADCGAADGVECADGCACPSCVEPATVPGMRAPARILHCPADTDGPPRVVSCDEAQGILAAGGMPRRVA